MITTDVVAARSVYAADFDGDADLDVISGAVSDHGVAWYENLGGGSFSFQRVIATDAGARSVYGADLDGDGDPDVLAAWDGSSKIAWYENRSDHGDDHTNEPATATLATALPTFLHGVLESDGDSDVFRFATGKGTVKVYANGPTNTYGWLLDEEGDLVASDDRAGNFLIEAEVEAGVHYIDVFGAPDETGPYTVSIEFVFADDHGSTPETATAVATLPWSGPGELERQGDRDVFRIDVDGPGTLTAYTTGATNTYGRLTDADGDVLAEDDDSGDEPNFEIKAGVAAGTYYVEVSGADGATGSYTLSIEFVADVSIAFGEQRVITTEADDARFVYAADFDGDLRLDVLSYSFRDDTVAWHRNEGQGAFSARRTINVDSDGGVVHVVDLDGDDDPDVLLASEQADTIGWHENLGSGDFSGYQNVATGVDRPRSVGAADLDGDGDADVLAASQDDETIAWYENTGGGVFGDRRVIATAAPGLASVADLDGDGDLDVLSAAAHDDTLAWHENLSDHGDDHSGALDGATRVIAMPAFLYGVLESAGDRDVFRVAAGQGTLRVHSNGPTDTLGRLLDAEGAQLAANDDAGEGLNFLIDTRVAAGVHYVEVRGFSTRIGPYSLSIEFIAD